MWSQCRCDRNTWKTWGTPGRRAGHRGEPELARARSRDRRARTRGRPRSICTQAVLPPNVWDVAKSRLARDEALDGLVALEGPPGGLAEGPSRASGGARPCRAAPAASRGCPRSGSACETHGSWRGPRALTGLPRPGWGRAAGSAMRVGHAREAAGTPCVNLLISKISRTSGWSAATRIVPPCARACREASMRDAEPDARDVVDAQRDRGPSGWPGPHWARYGRERRLERLGARVVDAAPRGSGPRRRRGGRSRAPSRGPADGDMRHWSVRPRRSRRAPGGVRGARRPVRSSGRIATVEVRALVGEAEIRAETPQCAPARPGARRRSSREPWRSAGRRGSAPPCPSSPKTARDRRARPGSCGLAGSRAE